MGLDGCQITQYSWLLGSTYVYWPNFLQVIFLLQLIRTIFHLDISFICLFGVIRVLFCVVCSLHSYRIVERESRGQEIPQSLMCRHCWGSFLNIAFFTEEAFFLVKSQKLSLGITLLKCQIIRISELSGVGLTFRHRASCILGQAFTILQRTLFIYLIDRYISLSDICLTVHHWYK